jgi:hypothetical protein
LRHHGREDRLGHRHILNPGIPRYKRHQVLAGAGHEQGTKEDIVADVIDSRPQTFKVDLRGVMR